MHIGIYSGTFDPIHKGHIALAEQALVECELDRVIFLPEARPRAKLDVTPFPHRLAMVQVAIAGHPVFSVIELRSEQFSVAGTLPELTGLFPGASFTLLIGSDVVTTFSDRWPDPDRLFTEMDIAVGLRGRDTEADVVRAMQPFPNARYQTLTGVHHNISSSAARGGAGADDIPPAVALYITDHSLYL